MTQTPHGDTGTPTGPGSEMVARVAPVWSLALVFSAPAPELGDISPYEAAKAGADPRDLASFARVVHSYWR
jgi:hypothetical protein